jgi:hypothetical protein
MHMCPTQFYKEGHPGIAALTLRVNPPLKIKFILFVVPLSSHIFKILYKST